jgi:alkylation response protein AidB-like acyl-CoA dehydrogenase
MSAVAEAWEFARTHLPVDGTADFGELAAKFHAAGLANWWLPESYGGRGVPLLNGVEIAAQLAYADAGFAFSSLVSVIGCQLLQLHGRDPLRSEVLAELASSGGQVATLGSEHGCGSELNRMGTRARLQGSTVVLNGEKAFSTNADRAEQLLVFAAADLPDQPFVAVLVPRQAAGVRIGPRWQTVGLASSPVYPVSFTDCVLSTDRVLDGHGLRLLESGLNASRILISATAIGMSRRIRDVCIEHAGQRTVKGAALSRSELFATRLAQMEVGIEAMLAVCRTAAAEYDRLMSGPDPAEAFLLRGTLKSALTAKVFCGQTGWQIASSGSEALGGLGYTDATPVGRLLRDMRYVSVVEGGDDVLRQLIYSRYVLPAARRS